MTEDDDDLYHRMVAIYMMLDSRQRVSVANAYKRHPLATWKSGRALEAALIECGLYERPVAMVVDAGADEYEEVMAARDAFEGLL